MSVCVIYPSPVRLKFICIIIHWCKVRLAGLPGPGLSTGGGGGDQSRQFVHFIFHFLYFIFYCSEFWSEMLDLEVVVGCKLSQNSQ